MHFRYREKFTAGWSALEKRLLPSYVWTSDPLTFWRERILFIIYFIATVFSPIVLVPSLWLSYREKLWIVILIDVLSYIAVVSILIVRNVSYVVRALVICFILYAIGFCILFILGPFGGWYIWLFCASVLISIFIGLSAAIWTLVFNAIVMLSVGIFIAYGNSAWILHMDNALEKWLVMSINFFLLNSAVSIITAFMLNSLKTAIFVEQKTSKSLRGSEARLRGITQNLPVIIFQFYAKDSGEYGMNYVSEPLAEFLKIEENIDTANLAALFPLFLSYIHEEDRDRFLNSIKTAVETGTSWNFEGRVATVSGKIIWVQGLSTPMRQEDQIVFDGILLDITERKRAEEMLKESENKYRLLADNIQDVIFVMDMNLNYTYLSPSVKLLRGYEPEEAMKHTPEETVTPSSMDLALGILSEMMEMEKSEHRNINISRTAQLEMTRKDGTTVWVETKAFFMRDENQRPVGIMGLTRDINERKLAEEKLQQTLESLRKAVGTTIQVLVSALESRDPYTSGHQSRSADLARAIAREMGLTQEEIEGIRMAGSIHDIGKLSIPAEILSKPSKLTNIEFSLIKEHARIGYEMLKDVESPWPLAEIVYQHHERMNGSGYPRNLKGDEIIMESRILAVADVVEAIASHRPYRAALGIEAALEEIEKNRGILYDNAVADACLGLFREKGYQLI